MFASLLAGIGLPVLAKLVGFALGKLSHPLAKAASDALGRVTDAIGKGEVPPEAINEANRHLETMAQIEADRDAVTLTEVNRTIRREVASDDPYVRRMRPTFGYIIALTWLGQMGAVAYLIAIKPAFAVEVIAALDNLSTSWSVALGVLGIYVYKRSHDKSGPLSLPDGGGIARLAEKLFQRTGGGVAPRIPAPTPRDPYAER